MRAFLLISVGGIVGANARYLVSLWAARRWPGAFPAGTFIVNVTGSLLLGFVTAFAAARLSDSPDVRLLVGIGFCGAYTTFSTFTFESLVLARQRAHAPALLNVAGSVVAGVVAGAAGIMLGSVAR
jgi:CrcB protein